jgi:hypothetical protein
MRVIGLATVKFLQVIWGGSGIGWDHEAPDLKDQQQQDGLLQAAKNLQVGQAGNSCSRDRHYIVK